MVMTFQSEFKSVAFTIMSPITCNFGNFGLSAVYYSTPDTKVWLNNFLKLQ